MKKLILIIKREFIAKVRNRSFIIMTFLSPLIVIAMGFLIFFLMKKNDEKVKNIVFVDESGLFKEDVFINTETIKYQDFTELGLVGSKEKVKNGDFYGVLHISKLDSLEVLANSVEFFSKDTPSMTVISSLEGKIERKIRNEKLTKFGIDLEKIKASKISSDIKMFDFSGEKSSKLKNEIKIILGAVAGYLLFFFLMVYGTSVMRSVIEEKTSRIIEVIVSSVKPFQLMMGKIIGNISAGLLQFIIWGILFLVLSTVLSAVFGMNSMEVQSAKVSPEQIEAMTKAAEAKGEIVLQELFRLPILKLYFLIVFYFLGGCALYSSFFAAVGAAVDNETDTQQFMMPIMLPLIFGAYVCSFIVIHNPHGPISKIFSYIPLTSPIVMLGRLPFGVAWWEIALSMLLLVLTFLFTVWLAAKIYRVGVLSYGKKPSYKDLWKWIRYSG